MKARSLSNLEADCQSLRAELSALEGELGTELLSQLDISDQREVRLSQSSSGHHLATQPGPCFPVCPVSALYHAFSLQVEELTEDIESTQHELRRCLGERTDLETKKNNLQHMLTNNLLKTKAELQRELEDVSMSDRKQQLEMTAAELTHLDSTIMQNQKKYGGVYVCVCVHVCMCVCTCVCACVEPERCGMCVDVEVHMCACAGPAQTQQGVCMHVCMLGYEDT